MTDLRKPLSLLAICLAVFLTVLPAFAAVRQLIIQHFDDEVVVGEDGIIDVTETIEARFVGENWHGLYRSTPVECTNPKDATSNLRFTFRMQTIRRTP